VADITDDDGDEIAIAGMIRGSRALAGAMHTHT